MVPPEATVEWALQNSDPANLFLLALIYKKLSDRLLEVQEIAEQAQDEAEAVQDESAETS